jgi:hypothetical protein
MAITYYMLQIPSWLLFILITSFGTIFTGVATYFFRKYSRVRILKSHNEVTGFFFLAIASFYALLLSFVMFLVWDEMNDTKSNVSKEGSSAMALYRDIKFYPDTVESKELMVLYLDFVFNVIDEEFPNMDNMKVATKTMESFNAVYYKMEHLNPKNQFQIQLVAVMFNHLNELATYRGLRITSIEMEIPPPMWFPLILGAIITFICAMLLDIEHNLMHVALNALLGTFVGMFFFIIILLDHPFTGNLSVKPQSYKQIFTMDEWANKHHLKK